MKPTYTIPEDRRSITCNVCGSISHHQQDVEQRYCGQCHVFHDTLRACPWCDEPVMPGDHAQTINHFDGKKHQFQDWHWECSMRAVIGGVNHLSGQCSCCGGTQPPDPPDMTVRQAAMAAVDYFYLTEKKHGCQP